MLHNPVEHAEKIVLNELKEKLRVTIFRLIWAAFFSLQIPKSQAIWLMFLWAAHEKH